MSKFKRNNKVTRAMAEEQVELLNEFYDVDMEYMIDQVATVVQQHLLGITKSVVRGRISIDETDTGVVVTQILESPVEGIEKITYKEIDAKAIAAVDRAEGEAKVLAMVGALTATDPEVLKTLSRVDKTTCEDLGNYFLFV